MVQWVGGAEGYLMWRSVAYVHAFGHDLLCVVRVRNRVKYPNYGWKICQRVWEFWQKDREKQCETNTVNLVARCEPAQSWNKWGRTQCVFLGRTRKIGPRNFSKRSPNAIDPYHSGTWQMDNGPITLSFLFLYPFVCFYRLIVSHPTCVRKVGLTMLPC